MAKLCKACQEEERMRMPSGQLSALCETCYRDTQENARAALPQRVCKTCNERKPVADFPKNGEYRKSSCKACYAALVAGAKKQTLTPDAVRTCHDCRIEKPLSEFRRQGTYHQALCIPCYNARKAETERRKATGQPKLARVQFKGKAPLENMLDGTSPAHEPPAPGMLLVDRARGQVLLCRVEGEVSVGARNIDHLIAFYASRGHRIVDAVESLVDEVIHERAI